MQERRRLFWARARAFTWAAVAAELACGSVSEEVDGRAGVEVGAKSPPTAGIAPVEGPVDTLVIALRRLPSTFDPLAELDPWGQHVVDDLLFEGLMRRRSDAAPWAEPALAEGCEMEPDGGVICVLREGIRFHDGTPVTRDDVLYSLSLWLGARGQSLRQRHGLDGLRAVEPVPERDREVRLVFESEDPLALEKIVAMKIVPKSRHTAGKFAALPIGTGPFRFVAPAEGEEVRVFERTSPRPQGARRIVLQAFDDGAAGLTALRRGEVHVLAEVAPVHVPKELAKPAMASRFVAYLVSPARYDLLLFNLREGVQAGPRMRQVLDLTASRSELALQVYGSAGLGARAPVDLHAPTPIDLVALAEGRDAEAGLGPFAQAPDPAGDAAARVVADTILVELGWVFERGVRRRQTATLRIPLTWDGSSGLATGVARALRSAWKEIGIIAPSVTASWAYVLSNLLRPGKFSMALVRLSSGSDVDLYPWFHSRGAHNLTGISDGILDASLASYRLAKTREERDAAKRAIAERLMAIRPVVVLHAPAAVTLISRSVAGIEFVDDLPRLDRLGFVEAGGR